MLRLLTCLILLTLGVHAEYTVRIVTISAPELPAIRACLSCSPSGENELRREFLPYFAEPVCDMLLRCGEGTAKHEAIVETPYPTEFDPPAKESDTTLPSAFAVKNVGYTAEVEIKAAAGDAPASIAVVWQRVGDEGYKQFPLVEHPDSPPIIQPRFTTEGITARFAIVPGQWRLIGMTRPHNSATPARTLLTFVQVNDIRAPRPASTPPPGSRLHLLTFRIPLEEGMNLASRPAGDDAALLDTFLERAARGDITLAGHDACLVHPQPESKALESTVVSSDPFADPQSGLISSNEKTEAASIAEVAFATEYNPDPSAFAIKNAGHRLTLDGHTIEWELVGDAPKMVPRSPQPGAATITDPEFSSEALHLHTGVPPGVARLAALSLLPDNGGPRMMHVHFIKSAGPPVKDPSTRSEIHCAVFSLTPQDHASLSRLDQSRSARALQSLVETSQARILAWQGLTAPRGTSASANRSLETPSGAGGKVGRFGALVLPKEISVHTRWTNLEMTVRESGAAPDAAFSLDLTIPPVFSLAELQSAASSGVALPDREDVTLTLKPLAEKKAPLVPGTPRLQFSAPLKLPPGHPEHGRKHVVLMLAR